MTCHHDRADRTGHILASQLHCDSFLTPIADPAGKSVLVVGAGAGTEILWCLRRGAREVVGIDVLPPDLEPLRLAARDLGIRLPARLEVLQMRAEDSASLGRRFDLVLSNNLLEHVADVAAVLSAFAVLVEPRNGTVAGFSSPLFHSSAGSHLQHEPWAHLWEEPEALRERVLARGIPTGHALETLDLETYMAREITLNRMRVSDFMRAVGESGLQPLQLKFVADRDLNRFSEFVDRLGRFPVIDLLVEGVQFQLVSPEYSGADDGEFADEIAELQRTRVSFAARLNKSLATDDTTGFLLACDLAIGRFELERTRRRLERLEQSRSFRAGRALSWPVRALREFFLGRSRPHRHRG